MSVGHPATGRLRTVEERDKAWYQRLFQFPDVAEALLQRDDWKLFREWLKEEGDLEQYLNDLSRPGALTAGLNWYLANLDPQLELQRRTPPPAVGRWRYGRIEGDSHWMQIDDPDRVNELLLEFLGARDASR